VHSEPIFSFSETSPALQDVLVPLLILVFLSYLYVTCACDIYIFGVGAAYRKRFSDTLQTLLETPPLTYTVANTLLALIADTFPIQML
jgi:hypothetical protein